MTPLALGLDAETALLVAFLIQIAVLVLLATTLAYWTYLDAAARGSDAAAAWAIAVAVFLPLAPGYLLYRHRIGARSGPIERTERAVGTVCVASALALFVPLEFTPPDPLLNAYGAVVVFPVGLGVGYLLVARGGYARLRRSVRGIAPSR